MKTAIALTIALLVACPVSAQSPRFPRVHKLRAKLAQKIKPKAPDLKPEPTKPVVKPAVKCGADEAKPKFPKLGWDTDPEVPEFRKSRTNDIKLYLPESDCTVGYPIYLPRDIREIRVVVLKPDPRHVNPSVKEYDHGFGGRLRSWFSGRRNRPSNPDSPDSGPRDHPSLKPLLKPAQDKLPANKKPDTKLPAPKP